MRLTAARIALLFTAEAAAFAFLALGLVDREVHRRDPVYGVNQWGYRDEARARKDPGETRLALIGGSAAFEANTAVVDTLAGLLFFELRDAGAPNRQTFSVLNLSEPRVGADSYVETLRRYAFLEPDIICVFDGYDALTGVPPHARRRSLVFRATGYLPLLPSRLLGRAGWMSDPDGGVADVLVDGRGRDDISCRGASAAYCNAMADTVRAALEQTKAVVVVSPPAVSSRHLTQQQSLGTTLTQQFGHDGRLTYLDFTSAIDLSKPTNSPDGVHRTLEGNHVIAQRLAPVILKRLPNP